MPKFNYFWTLSKMAEKSRGRSCSEPFNWAKISCEECHWPISMVRFVKLMVKLALNACQLGNKIDTYNDTFCWLLFQINRTISHSCLGPAWYCCQPIRTRSQASDMMKWYQYVTWPCKACLYLGKYFHILSIAAFVKFFTVLFGSWIKIWQTSFILLFSFVPDYDKNNVKNVNKNETALKRHLLILTIGCWILFFQTLSSQCISTLVKTDQTFWKPGQITYNSHWYWA